MTVYSYYYSYCYCYYFLKFSDGLVNCEPFISFDEVAKSEPCVGLKLGFAGLTFEASVRKTQSQRRW